MNPQRGSFPKSTVPETPDQQRARYEQWVVSTRVPVAVDPLADAVESAPHIAAELGKRATMRPSMKLCIRARCWQCVAGDSDVGGSSRIAECSSRECALWSVRPYKTKDEPLPEPIPTTDDTAYGDFLARAMEHPGQRGPAVKGYCFSCCGGKREIHTMRAVTGCPAVTCALWPVRPVGKESEASGCKGAENPEFNESADAIEGD